jgi:hypothetical protein
MPDTEDSGSGDWIPDEEGHRMDTEQKKMTVMRGEDIPFADEDIPYSEDDSSETLMEDIVLTVNVAYLYQKKLDTLQLQQDYLMKMTILSQKIA